MTQGAPQSTLSTTSLPLQTSSLAIVSLVSGIASWFVLPLIGALVAVITGHIAQKEIRESKGRLGGLDMAKAGLILGYVHLALFFLGICLFVAILTILVAGISVAGVSSGYIHIIP